jgi:hypothetical protein
MVPVAVTAFQLLAACALLLSAALAVQLLAPDVRGPARAALLVILVAVAVLAVVVLVSVAR